MAQGVVIRFKADSTEYDAKLKRSIEQMKSMEDQAKKLNGTIDRTDEGYVKFIQSLGQMDTIAKSSRTALREYSEAILYLQQQYKALSDTEKSGDVGKAMAASIQQLKVRAAEVKDAMEDMNRELSGMASDTQAFDQIAGGVTLMTSVIQVGQGALQAFGVENEDAAQAIAKLQGVMAITSGLQQIQNALQKESNVMLGVSKVQTLAAAAAETVANKAKQANIVATKAATVAQKALNLVANANPYVLLATAVVAVTSALWAMSKASKAAKEAEEQREKAAEEAAQKADAQRQSFVDASAEAMGTASRISALQVAYQKSNSEMEKTGVLKQAQDEFKKLGISCNSVTEAQTLLMSKGGQIIELLKMQGTIAALNAIRMEKYKESFKNLLAQGYEVAGAAALAGANKEVRELDAQIISLQTKSQNLKGDLGVGKKQSESAPKVAVEPVIPEGSAAALKKKISELEKQWDMATSDDERSGIQKQIDDAQKALDTMRGKLKDMPPVEVPITFSEKGISDLGKKIKDNMAGLEIGSGDYLIAASNMVDFTAFENLLKAATENGLKIDNEWFASLFEDIKVGADVDPESWNALVDSLNKQLADLGLPPIVLDVDTGSVTQLEKKLEDLPTKFELVQEAIDNMKTGVDAISTIGNAFNELKGIGEDLEKAFSGDMDTWDAMMTVFNSGISILQTVMGVMEAINTLTELGAALKEKNAMAAATEATAVVTGKSTETAAETAETAVAATATGVKAGEAAAGAGEAVSGIPIVGPILAVAAIAAVLGAVIAAVSKAKSAGKGFAMGGIVPGNSFSGDNLRTSDFGINSGELILNKAQQDSVAGQLQGNGMDGGTITGAVTGKDLILTIQNQQKSLGIPTISQLKG